MTTCSPQKDRQTEWYTVLVIREIQLRWAWLVTSWSKLNELQYYSPSEAWWKGLFRGVCGFPRDDNECWIWLCLHSLTAAQQGS